MPTTVYVELFAGARDAAGTDRVPIELAGAAEPTVAEVRRALAARYPELRALLEVSRFAVGQRYAEEEARLGAEAEVVMIPPVSGG